MSPAPTRTGGPDAACTVTVDVPVFPWLVAVMLAVPCATPTTYPRVLTPATPGALLAQAIVAPPTAFPFESFGVAVSCTPPYIWIVAVAGATSIEATGTVATVMAEAPLFPSLVAVTLTGPP